MRLSPSLPLSSSLCLIFDGGEGWGEWGFFRLDGRRQKLSAIPSGCPSYFLLLAQEKVTKEKGTPASHSLGDAQAVPCAARHQPAGANSRIHALEQSHLFPVDGCAARCESMGEVKAEEQEQEQGHVQPSRRAFVGIVPSRAVAYAFDFQPPSERRATQPASGERRACSSAWMREFAPARSRRVAQGTGAAQRRRRDVGSRFFWLLFFAAGVLPAALRAACGVRPRSCAARGDAKKSNSGSPSGCPKAFALPHPSTPHTKPTPTRTPPHERNHRPSPR